MKKVFLILLVLFSSTLQVKAEIIHAERGGASIATGLVKVKELAYETSLFNYVDEFDGDKSWSFLLGSSKFRYGLLDRFELRLTNSGLLVNDDVAGFDNLGLGFKLALLEEEHGLLPALNLVTDFQIPIGRKELRNPGFDHSYLFLASHKITDRLTALMNMGLAFNSIRADATTVDIPYVFNLNYALSDKLVVFTDTYGQWGLSSLSPSPLSQDIGVNYAITDDFISTLSLNLGLNETAPAFGLDLGMVLRLF